MSQRIGKYDVLAQLTSGGMAELCLGCTAGPGGFRKYVVLKRILPDAANDEVFVQMFLDEARITAAFSHANIAQVFDLGEDRKSGLYVAMEFIPGQNLNEVVEACARQAAVLPLGFSVAVVHDCALALHYAHTFKLPTGEPSPVIHRDVAQKNVMVTYEGQVKLLDFGIAKAKNALSRTKAGTVKGTAGYMSPEQVRGEVVDARSDVFSLGVVLWEMVTGRRLFAADTELEELRLILSGPIEPPDQVEPSVPEPLGRVAMRALERDKHKRFASARDFARALATECGDLLFDVDERAAFMKDRFASKMESTRKLFEAAAATVSEAEVEEAARAYRDSRQHDEKGKTPARPRVAAAKSPKASANKLPQVSASKLPKVSANKLKPVGASARKLPLVETDTEAQVPVAPAPTGERPAVKSPLVVGALAIVVAVGALVAWKLAGGAPVAEEGPVTPDIAAIPGAGGPEDEPDPPADVPPQKAADSRPGDSRTSEPKTPSKVKGEVTLVLLPEGTVTKGKQELGRGMMMTFSLPVGTHLVTVVGPDGVKRKLSLPVQQGKNKPLKLQVAELPAQ
ncbi:MAG: protein kinase [Myxococcales bacterium]|nr:protein kinase [Myxococcales bacterium]